MFIVKWFTRKALKRAFVDDGCHEEDIFGARRIKFRFRCYNANVKRMQFLVWVAFAATVQCTQGRHPKSCSSLEICLFSLSQLNVAYSRVRKASEYSHFINLQTLHVHSQRFIKYVFQLQIWFAKSFRPRTKHKGVINGHSFRKWFTLYLGFRAACLCMHSVFEKEESYLIIYSYSLKKDFSCAFGLCNSLCSTAWSQIDVQWPTWEG